MRVRRSNLLLSLTALIAITLAISYFFRSIEDGKEAAGVDLYAVVPDGMNALLIVNRSKLFRDKLSDADSFPGDRLPSVLLSIIRQTKESSVPLLLSFHPQGIVLYTKADKKSFDRIRTHVLKSRFAEYLPQNEKIGDVTFSYYPDVGNRYLGYFRHKGLFVASYSKKLLEEVARIHSASPKPSITRWSQELMTLNHNAPINLILPSRLFELHFTQSDTTHWSYPSGWIPLAIEKSEEGVYSFSSTLHGELPDSLCAALADTVASLLRARFPGRSVTNEVSRKNDSTIDILIDIK